MRRACLTHRRGATGPSHHVPGGPCEKPRARHASRIQRGFDRAHPRGRVPCEPSVPRHCLQSGARRRRRVEQLPQQRHGGNNEHGDSETHSRLQRTLLVHEHCSKRSLSLQASREPPAQGVRSQAGELPRQRTALERRRTPAPARLPTTPLRTMRGSATAFGAHVLACAPAPVNVRTLSRRRFIDVPRRRLRTIRGATAGAVRRGTAVRTGRLLIRSTLGRCRRGACQPRARPRCTRRCRPGTALARATNRPALCAPSCHASMHANAASAKRRRCARKR